MSKEEAYKDMKEFTCTGCGQATMATKFASKKTVLCDTCKTDGIKPNADIVASILAKTPQKVDKPKDNGKANSPDISDDGLKDAVCICCEKSIRIGKFASPKTAKCDECKGSYKDEETGELQELDIDLSRLRDMPSIEEYTTMPSLIANPRLRNVECPACGRTMKILRIVDYSVFGIIIMYQCQHCKAIINLSEQCNHLIKNIKAGTAYDYSGNAINELLSSTTHTRLHTTVETLIKKCKDNNIEIDGIELPQYRFEEERPVPVGYVIPSVDKWVSTMSELIKIFKTAERIGTSTDEPEGTKNIIISDTLAIKLAKELEQLLKEE